MTDIQLFRFPGSNACVTVERLLDMSGIEWRERRMRPILHVATLRRHGFPRRTAPAAIIDGVHVQGSRDISRAIAEAHPELHLIPTEEPARSKVLDAEAKGEQLQNAVRRIFYVLAQHDRNVVRPIVDGSFGALPEFARDQIARVMVPMASKGHAAKAERIEGYLERASGLIAGFDALVDEGVLGTDSPNVADFQIGPNLAALASCPTAAPFITSRPSWRIAEHTCPTYPITLTVDIPETWLVHLEGAAG